jgi:SAM-dependent methyltransferase
LRGVTIAALSDARAFLDGADYSPSALAARLGTGPSLRLQGPSLARARASLGHDRPLDVLASLFLLGDDVEANLAESILGDGLATLAAAGLSERSGDRVRPLLQLVPHDDLVIASDLPGPAASGDFVPGVQAPSDLLARLTPRESVGAALDVGTGNGIQALLLARHAEGVVATDVSSRALEVARTNAALNAATNIEFRLGGLLEPVAGERFDLVVANPPYVISPEHAFVFRDAPGRGDELVRELVQGLPGVLADGGLALVLVSWVATGGTPEPLSWTTEPGVGRLLLASRLESAAEAAHTWNKDRISDQRDYEERVTRWLAFYEGQEIESIGYGALVLCRDSRGAGWASLVGAPLDRPGSAGPHVLRLVANHSALAAASGRVEALGRIVLAPDAELTHRRRRGPDGLETVGVEIRLPGGIGTAADLDAGGDVLARAFAEPRTVREAIDRAAAALGLERTEIEDGAASLVRTMLGAGFLELPDDRSA